MGGATSRRSVSPQAGEEQAEAKDGVKQNDERPTADAPAAAIKKKKGFLLDGCSPEKVFSVYEKKNQLGEGAFAKVYKANLKQKGRMVPDSDRPVPDVVAIKVINKTKMTAEELPALENEIRVLKRIKNKNCVRLIEYFEEAKYLYVVMDIHDGGELFDRIVNKGQFNESEAAACVKQIALALAYCESINVVHRDLKPENLIYDGPEDNANLLITDFGLAQDISAFDTPNPLTDACGTPGYIAPEVLNRGPYGHQADMWGLGVILFILLCGYPPFYSEDQSVLFHQIRTGQYSFDERYWSEISEDAKSVVRALLTVDPAVRLSPSELLKEGWVADPEAQRKENLGDHVLEGLTQLRKQKFNRAILKIRTIQAMGGFSAMAKKMREEEEAKKLQEEAEIQAAGEEPAATKQEPAATEQEPAATEQEPAATEQEQEQEREQEEKPDEPCQADQEQTLEQEASAVPPPESPRDP